MKNILSTFNSKHFSIIIGLFSLSLLIFVRIPKEPRFYFSREGDLFDYCKILDLKKSLPSIVEKEPLSFSSSSRIQILGDSFCYTSYGGPSLGRHLERLMNEKVSLEFRHRRYFSDEFQALKTRASPDSILILSSVERNFPSRFSKHWKSRRFPPYVFKFRDLLTQTENRLQGFIMGSGPLYHFACLGSTLRYRYLGEFHPLVISGRSNPSYLFSRNTIATGIPGSSAYEMTESEIESMVRVIQIYAELARKKGYKFLFLPIPNKSRVLHTIAGITPSNYYSYFLTRLKMEGIEVLDIRDSLQKLPDHQSYYQTDTHWKPEARKITAELLMKRIRILRE